MLIDNVDAQEIYDDLRAISARILTALHCATEPGRRVRRWRHGRPTGMLFHYTGGQSGLKALKWGNHPGWGNTGSSWHVTVFDRKPDNEVGHLWDKYADPAMTQMFPVPTIINASWDKGTWHGNWTNNVTLGVENRNQGRSGHSIKSGDTYLRNDKPMVTAEGKVLKNDIDLMGMEASGYEQFTRDQILANAWLGHLVQGYFDADLDPDWLLTHQCVWATKSDTGGMSVFPIHQLRRVIANHEMPTAVNVGAGSFPHLGHTEEDDSGWWDMVNNEVRCEIESEVVPWAIARAGIAEENPGEVNALLYRMGFNTGMHGAGDLILNARRRKAIRILQKSTLAYRRRQNRRAEVLTTDGVAGPKTKAAIQTRIGALRLP